MAGKINIEAGEFLFREGESANYAYILDEGEIEIVKNGPDGVIKLSEITKGTIFGEMALLDGAPRSAGARATKKTSLTEVDGDTFLNYIRTNPKGALNIMQRLSGQLRQANKNLIDTNTKQGTTEGSELLDDENFSKFLSAINKQNINNVNDTDAIYDAGPRKPIIYSAFAVSLLVILSITFASIFSIDTTVSSRGKFLTKTPNIDIQATDNSVIKELFVQRGQIIKKGELIAILDGTIAKSNLKSNNDKLKSVNQRLKRSVLEQYLIKTGNKIPDLVPGLDPVNQDILSKRLMQYRSKISSLNFKISRLKKEVEFSIDNVEIAKEQLKLKRKIESVQKELHRQKVSALFKYLSAKDEALIAKKNYHAAKNSYEKFKTELQSALADKNEFVAKWSTGLGETESKETESKIQLMESSVKLIRQAEDVEIRSPESGIVLNIPTVGSGSIVKQGEKLLTIVRNNVPLALEVDIDPKDISDVQIGASVSVKLDALPFQEYGDLKGSLVFLSEDTYTESVSGDKGSFYRGRVDVQPDQLKTLPPNFRLTSGMAASADLLVGERILMSYFTRPLTKGFKSAFSEPD